MIPPAVFWAMTGLTLALVAGLPFIDSCSSGGGDAAGNAMSMGLGVILQIAVAGFVVLLAIPFLLIGNRIVRAVLTLLLCVPFFGVLFVATLMVGAC